MIGRESLRQAIVPAYIFLCIVLGGSGQGIWGNLVLQLLGIALIGWAVLAAPARPTGVVLRRLALIAIAAIALVALQLVPLPPGLWTNLPGRNLIARGYNSLGEPLPWLPLSLAPYRTLASALFLIPPIAILIGVAKLQACRRSWAVGAILLATLLSVFLGYIQVSTRSPSWYLYDFSNFGSAVGFFANRDHMGTLLLVAIPFIAVVLANGKGRERGEALAIWIGGVSSAIIVLAGIAMNGSLAAVLLALPVIVASALVVGRMSRRMRVIGLAFSLFAFIIGLALIADSPVQGKLLGTETASIEGRQEIWATSLKLAGDSFPLGTGFGSFEHLFHLYEAPGSVTPLFVNHAHNDYLELLVEGGLPALLLAIAFLAWWDAAARDAWRQGGTRLARAASIASFAILAHSLVDFPLRTSAIAAVFAFCLAVMADPVAEKEPAARTSEERRPRHVEIR